MLRQCGFAVAEAASGQAALDALERGEVCELLVIDIAMPGLSGVETVARARRRWPGLRVLYMTGYADAAGAHPDTGGEKLLKKPFRLHELRSAVRDALERRPHAERKTARPKRPHAASAACGARPRRRQTHRIAHGIRQQSAGRGRGRAAPDCPMRLAMGNAMLNAEQCWASVTARDAAADGNFCLCRADKRGLLPAGLPLAAAAAQNVAFFETTAAAEAAGFRAVQALPAGEARRPNGTSPRSAGPAR